MKGINLKKIGAIVAGATILASSVAFASVMYEDTELVNVNGQPVAKVVLGSKSQPSDGVVAAAIAAKLANSAYKKSTLSAAVAADVTCTAGAGNASATGNCTVTNEKVTLEVTVPGTTNTGIHEFSTLIGDYVDRVLGNRDKLATGANDDTYPTAGVSESSENANPFSLGGNAPIQSDAALYRVGSAFAPFASTTITNPSTGDTYTETQSAWVYSETEFVESDREIKADVKLLVYQVKFDESTHTGIPVCTTDEGSDKDYGNCNVTAPEHITKHRVKIKFLGSDWIITAIDPDTTEVSSTANAVSSGGSLTLAKESVYGIVNIGSMLESSDKQLKVRLDDISTLEGSKPAIVSFLDANNNTISQDQIAPGNTLKKTVAGKTYKVRVYQTAPGYTQGAKWVEMALLEQELELKDNTQLDNDKNKDWNVELVWKNKEASGTDARTRAPDTLRSILLKRDSFSDRLKQGEKIKFVENPTAYVLNYKGLNLASGDYDTLKYQKSDSQGGIKIEDVTTTAVLGHNIKISSSKSGAFEGNGGQDNKIYYAGTNKFDVLVANHGGGDHYGHVDIDEDNDIDVNDDGAISDMDGNTYTVTDGHITSGTGTLNVRFYDEDTPLTPKVVNIRADEHLDVDQDGNNDNEDVATNLLGFANPLSSTEGIYLIARSPTENNYKVKYIGGVATPESIKYSLAGELATNIDGGIIRLHPADAVTQAPQIILDEDAGKYEAAGGASDEHTSVELGVRFDPVADNRFESLTGAGADNKLTYAPEHPIPSYSAGDYEEGKFISPRGTKFDDISSTSVTFKVANKIGKALYEFATDAASTADPSTTLLTLTEGATEKIGDITIKVKSIDQTVTPVCSAVGGAATCTVAKDNVKAVIMPNNVATLDAIVPYTVDSKLVVLDQDAAAINTGVLITVGGDAVNTVSADAIAGTDIDFAVTPKVVKVVGNKIIVAGLTAADTIAAGDEFIAALKVQ